MPRLTAAWMPPARRVGSSAHDGTDAGGVGRRGMDAGTAAQRAAAPAAWMPPPGQDARPAKRGKRAPRRSGGRQRPDAACPGESLTRDAREAFRTGGECGSSIDVGQHLRRERRAFGPSGDSRRSV